MGQTRKVIGPKMCKSQNGHHERIDNIDKMLTLNELSK